MSSLLILTVGTGTAGKPACAGHADRHSEMALLGEIQLTISFDHIILSS